MMAIVSGSTKRFLELCKRNVNLQFRIDFNSQQTMLLSQNDLPSSLTL